MTEIALSTSGLNKKFGSLVVAGDISLELPRGARYALIGPNGAGKTTLINLMTGMLAPDSGKITLGTEDITAVPPDVRVKRGLVRTFQINTLFPNLTPLEAVTLAVCERRGEAGVWWKSLPSCKAAADEAYGILSSLRLGEHCERPTKQLAYGQQRLLEIALALASKPKVLANGSIRVTVTATGAGVVRVRSVRIGTSKLGIIPELVKKSDISVANGLSGVATLVAA